MPGPEKPLSPQQKILEKDKRNLRIGFVILIAAIVVISVSYILKDSFAAPNEQNTVPGSHQLSNLEKLQKFSLELNCDSVAYFSDSVAMANWDGTIYYAQSVCAKSGDPATARNFAGLAKDKGHPKGDSLLKVIQKLLDEQTAQTESVPPRAAAKPLSAAKPIASQAPRPAAASAPKTATGYYGCGNGKHYHTKANCRGLSHCKSQPHLLESINGLIPCSICN